MWHPSFIVRSVVQGLRKLSQGVNRGGRSVNFMNFRAGSTLT